MKKVLLFTSLLFVPWISRAEDYTVGVSDVIEINILQPEHSTNQTTVSPSGEISVPYLGSIKVKGKTLDEVQKMIQMQLAKGYFKYPVVTVSLIESRSRNYTISGEVAKPGTYPLLENMTVLKAISTAGGFTRFGSSSKVKILRPKKEKAGYDNITVDINKIIEGKSEEDIQIFPGDVIVVSESLF